VNTVTIVPVEPHTYTTVAVWLALVGIQNILIIINEALMLNISFSNAAGALTVGSVHKHSLISQSNAKIKRKVMNNKTMLQVTARLVHNVPIHQITRRFTHNFVTMHDGTLPLSTSGTVMKLCKIKQWNCHLLTITLLNCLFWSPCTVVSSLNC